ncbi:MAG TPA: tetraacyldisaccharide 4'-kinase [Caulobacteraceae bacterium]|nr:tetraacyldisaccharide 4'-kinase [Caulobacteraceae bacterium]
MKFKSPRWWYSREGAPGPVIRLLLQPLSWVWAWKTQERIEKATPFDAGVPVICVGNLTVGGVGKTPVVRALAARLADRGLQVAALSLGYGGRTEGPHRVDPALESADDVGDEPLMLALGGVTAWVARDRPAGAVQAAEGGAQVVIMDDGHQNPFLKKTLSLVVVDGETRNGEWPFGDGSVFPAGPLREPLKRGLARADAAIVMLPADLPAADPGLLALLAAKPVLIARLAPLAVAPPGPQMGFAGVAKPWKVERALRAAGCQLVDFASFPDHAPYSDDTLRALEARAQAYGASLITTEKDWVRLSPEWRAKVGIWPVAARFEDEAALDAVLAPVVVQAAAATSPAA